jgi:LuxR family maltose regulon positive regulatory protein
MSFRKYALPANSKLWTPRGSLMRKLTQAAGWRLVFVSAPAGSGKTVALTQWLAGRRNKVAWLNLTSFDNDVHTFYAGFLGAMAHARKSSRKLKLWADKAAAADAPREFFLKALTSLRDDEKDYILVLDDFQELENPDILDDLPKILHYLPSNFVFFVLSRGRAPEAFADAIAKNEIAFLNAGDLQFTTEDVQRLAGLRNVKLTEKEAADLCREVGGWAMGAGARLLRRQLEGSGAEGRFDPKADYFDEYVERHIWLKWDEETRDLLLRSALARELTPDFCSYVTEPALSRSRCLGLLDALWRENMFIACLGEERYRLHDLFRNWLLRKLDRPGGDLPAAARKAAQWFHRRELYFQALDLYVLGGDFEGIGRVIEAMSRYDTDISVERHLHFMQSLVRHGLPPEVVEADPHLLSLFAWGHFLSGRDDKFLGYLDTLRRQYGGAAGSDSENSLEAAYFLFSLDFRTPLLDCARDLAENILPHLPSLKPAGEDEVKLAQVNSITQNLPLAHRSMRDYSELAVAGEEGFALLRSTFGALIGPEYPVLEDSLRAGLHYERRETPPALAAARRACLASENGRSPEFYVCARAILYLLLVSQGASVEARKLADEVEEQLNQREASFLWPNFRALTCAAALAHGSRETAEEWLALHAATAGSGPLPLYKLPQHFTTARALLATGVHHSALLFLDRLRLLAERYRRPLDLMEADVLRARVLWSLGEMAEALEILAGALAAARPGGLVQVFLREMPPLTPLLRVLAFRDGQAPENRQFILRILDLAAAKAAPLAPLSPQRRAILRSLEKDLGNQAIAEDLNISPNTVKTHLKSIFRLLGVESRQEAVKVARVLNMI